MGKEGRTKRWPLIAGGAVIVSAVGIICFSATSDQWKLERSAALNAAGVGGHQAAAMKNRGASVEKEAEAEEERVTSQFSLNHRFGYSQPSFDSKRITRQYTIRQGKVAYLTFYDGPSRSTESILHILSKYAVPATFFVTGKTSEENIKQLKLIAEKGHAIGNHTFSHDYSRIYASVQAFKADMEKLNRFLKAEVGVSPDIIRFPGGSNNRLSWKTGGRSVMKAIAREMSNNGYSYFDWNVSSTDAAAAVQPKEDIVQAVKSNSAGKDKIIVLMHDMDRKTTTVEALPEVIEYLKDQGYRFDRLHKDSFKFQFLKL
ncbi:polysaccharide deacetylase [Paenibacillus sp. H1-7]|uniref:polysaccharide deacetylase family protein n=1 Tax=Paenibacillus sp. H1-7 TaxID=2282849 RepID=UPI001EF7E74C|nr:polysaccharide deacetylase family protein [Paenibacillus sp. H1-7]ULL19149.1 polysaccharide deacetylase [Paenibacillus sp. H1-7]